jgi:Flp pilus assembly protein TadG
MRHSRSQCFRSRNRKGAAVVEFAVLAPVLIALLLGIIECGRMIMVQQSLATAAPEGARQAIVEGTSVDTAKSTVDSFLNGVGVKGASITIVPGNTGSVAHGQPIIVSVSIPFSKVSWLKSPFFLKNTTLHSQATMRRETPN